jgi:replicative DNA helicase
MKQRIHITRQFRLATGKADLEIEKRRGGPCRDIELRWDAKRTMFTSAEPEPNQW